MIASFGSAAFAACHYMTCPYSSHKCSNWWLQSSSDPGHYQAHGWLVCRRGDEEEGAWGRREGTDDDDDDDDGILASDCV